MSDEPICDNCNIKKVSLFVANMKFFIAPCQHCFCSDCVNREIEGNLNFHCPKCNRLIQKSDLREETREVFETKKIREARERALKILRKLFDDYDSDEAKKYTQQRDVLFLNILNENKSIEEKADDLSLDTDDSKRTEYVNNLKKLIAKENEERNRKREKNRTKDDQSENSSKKQKIESEFYSYILSHFCLVPSFYGIMEFRFDRSIL